MAVLLPKQVTDLVLNAHNTFQRNDYVDISMPFPQYIAAEIMQDKSRLKESAGHTEQWQVKTKNEKNTRVTGLFDKDKTSIENVWTTAQLNLVMYTTNFSFDVNERVFSQGAQQIVDYVKAREKGMLNEFWATMEEHLWSAGPPAPTNAPAPIFGIPFWLQKAADSVTTYGLYGLNPSGYTSGAAGISSTTYPQWANPAGIYGSVTLEDFVSKLTEMKERSTFIAPHDANQLVKPGGWNYGMYTTYPVLRELRLHMEGKNDSAGWDISKMGQHIAFGGVPIKYVEYLTQTDVSDPIYGVNWNIFKFLYVKGLFMRKSDQITVADSHNMRVVHLDTSTQLTCEDRRSGGFVLSKKAA
jgi:hypothetical protein